MRLRLLLEGIKMLTLRTLGQISVLLAPTSDRIGDLKNKTEGNAERTQ